MSYAISDSLTLKPVNGDRRREDHRGRSARRARSNCPTPACTRGAGDHLTTSVCPSLCPSPGFPTAQPAREVETLCWDRVRALPCHGIHQPYDGTAPLCCCG